MRAGKALLSLFLLSGCMIGPNYQRPYVDIPDDYHFEVKDAKDTLNLLWWRGFGDDILLGLIDEALANNRDIKIAAANVENAAGILMQTTAPLFPQIGYTGNYSKTQSSNTLTGVAIPITAVPPNPLANWLGILNGSWDIDVWGRTRRQIEAARANYFATYEERQNVILTLVASVANAYIQLRSYDKQLLVSIDTMESYRESVIYFETQFKYGQASEMSVASAKTQYETAAAKVPQLRALIVQTENALNVLLARNPGPIERGKPIEEINLPDVPEGIPSEILCQRPDVRQAEQQLIAANANIGAVLALYFPSFSLTGYLGDSSRKLHQLFNGHSNIWNYVGSVAGPIFTAGAIYGQEIQARAQEEAALQNYLQTIQSAFADVETALESRTMLVEQLDALKRLVEASGDYVRLATLQFKGGYAPYFTVIQAQEQYFPAELSWVQARGQLLQSIVNIYQEMGGGWVDVAEVLTAGDSDIDKIPGSLDHDIQIPDIPSYIKNRNSIQLAPANGSLIKPSGVKFLDTDTSKSSGG